MGNLYAATTGRSGFNKSGVSTYIYIYIIWGAAVSTNHSPVGDWLYTPKISKAMWYKVASAALTRLRVLRTNMAFAHAHIFSWLQIPPQNPLLDRRIKEPPFWISNNTILLLSAFLAIYFAALP